MTFTSRDGSAPVREVCMAHLHICMTLSSHDQPTPTCVVTQPAVWVYGTTVNALDQQMLHPGHQR